MPALEQPYLGFYPDAELVLALVCPVGVDHSRITDTIRNRLRQFGYETNSIRLSDWFPALFESLGMAWAPPGEPRELALYMMDAGNRIRKETGSVDLFAQLASGLIRDWRARAHGSDEAGKLPRPRTAHVISTLKRAEEVETLRRVYGPGFFLVGVAPSKSETARFFKERGFSPEDIDRVTLRDADEARGQTGTNDARRFGQQTRRTFELADVFMSAGSYDPEIERFLDLLFGAPTVTPSPMEHAMFLAYAASLRSGDLSRQVGAALVDDAGDILAVGFNEVPKSGGGAYAASPDSHRDIERGHDSNEKEKRRMVQDVLRALGHSGTYDDVAESLRPTGLLDITEYGRAVHAEMDALLSCARGGRSTRGTTLYTTTFPCHNCCRHILASGVKKVVYIEPYPKSKASDLHDDAITIDQPEGVSRKVPFVPFIGVGPRRYFDLFSLRLSTGYELTRKAAGELATWNRSRASIRLQMQPTTYLDREQLAFDNLTRVLSKNEGLD